MCQAALIDRTSRRRRIYVFARLNRHRRRSGGRAQLNLHNDVLGGHRLDGNACGGGADNLHSMLALYEPGPSSPSGPSLGRGPNLRHRHVHRHRTAQQSDADRRGGGPPRTSQHCRGGQTNIHCVRALRGARAVCSERLSRTVRHASTTAAILVAESSWKKVNLERHVWLRNRRTNGLST